MFHSVIYSLFHFVMCFSLAKSQQYDQDGLIDIFTQYGDHLYSKGDHDGAIDQYIKTIGKLEASYVIRKVSSSPAGARSVWDWFPSLSWGFFIFLFFRERSLMVQWVVTSILHGVDPLSYFSFQPVLPITELFLDK